MAQTSKPKKALSDDPRFAQAVQNYEAGLRAMQEHKFDKAKGFLQKVLAGPSVELADRAKTHLSTCSQHIDRTAHQFKSPEEHFDYAISLMNVGDYVSAREHLDKLTKQNPKMDYVSYGMAALDCLTGEADSALKNLKVAIDLRSENRYHAHNDEDFAFLQEDPRFTELLYPEKDGTIG